MLNYNAANAQTEQQENQKEDLDYLYSAEEPVKNDVLGVWRNCFYKRGDASYVFYPNASKFLLPY